MREETGAEGHSVDFTLEGQFRCLRTQKGFCGHVCMHVYKIIYITVQRSSMHLRVSACVCVSLTIEVYGVPDSARYAAGRWQQGAAGMVWVLQQGGRPAALFCESLRSCSASSRMLQRGS